VWIGSASERDYTEGVRELAGARTLNLAGRTTAGEFVALLAGAALVVSNDSGPMHVAAALGTPTLGLFGPETPQMYAPVGLATRVLYRPPPCSPCINVHDNKVASCVFGFPQCLVQIPVDEVLAAARALLAGEQELVHELEPAPRSEVR
jgi:ADP-heptose:LPS heptosyltransferase